MQTSRSANSNTPLPRSANTGPRLPLSGSEEPFTSVTYGTPRGVNNNNCYGWAIGRYRGSGGVKLQPGNLSASPGTLNLSACDSVVQRALADLKGDAYSRPADAPCARGYYKVMAFLAKNNDYHWYKQHKDVMVKLSTAVRDVAGVARALGVRRGQVYAGTPRPKPGDTVLVKDAGLWSHKQGFATPPLLRDACGKAIRDPRRACRKYSDRLNYTDYCGALCVKSKPTRQ